MREELLEIFGNWEHINNKNDLHKSICDGIDVLHHNGKHTMAVRWERGLSKFPTGAMHKEGINYILASICIETGLIL